MISLYARWLLFCELISLRIIIIIINISAIYTCVFDLGKKVRGVYHGIMAEILSQEYVMEQLNSWICKLLKTLFAWLARSVCGLYRIRLLNEVTFIHANLINSITKDLFQLQTSNEIFLCGLL